MASRATRGLRNIDRASINSTQAQTDIVVNQFASAPPTGELYGPASTVTSTDNVQTGNSSATATSTANTGIFNTPITLNRRGSVTVRGTTQFSATAQGTAAGTLSSGTATADARFTNDTGGIISYYTSPTDVSGVPIPLRDISNNLLGGYAPAANNTLEIKQTGQVIVDVENSAEATARGADGATATADFTDASGSGGFFGIANTNVAIGAGAEPTPGGEFQSFVDSAVYGGLSTTAVSSDGNATASTGDNTGTTNIAGIYNVGVTTDPSGGPLTIQLGGSGSVAGFAGYELVDEFGDLIPIDPSNNVISTPISLSASATTVEGDASANVLAGVIGGIFNDNVPADPSGVGSPVATYANDLDITINGPLSVVSGGAFVTTDATATSQNGSANANVETNVVAGIADANALANGGLVTDPDGFSSITFNSSGTVNAAAIGRNTATASNDSNDSNLDPSGGIVSATINSDGGALFQTVGLSIGAVNIAGDGSLGVQAQSFQDASASSVVNGDDPYAEVAWNNQVVGVLNTPISVGEDLQGVFVAAGLEGSANARSETGSNGTVAWAGEDAQVAGFQDSELNVGGSIVPGQGVQPPLQVIASSDLQATARSQGDDVAAFAGGGLFDLSGASVVGIDNTDITVGGTGLIDVNVTGNVEASATTSNGGSAVAAAVNTAVGVRDSDIFFGNGTGAEVLNIDVQQTGSATAIGSEDPSFNQLGASLVLEAAGVQFGLGDGITVAQGSGNVIANVVNGGNVSAQAGSADASGNLDVLGSGDVAAGALIANAALDLRADRSFIDLGTTGSIDGISKLGVLNPAGALTPASVTAETQIGDADVSGAFVNFGILGNDGDTVLRAGSTSGGIQGAATSSATATADVGGAGNATANQLGVTVGIYGADLYGGTGNASANPAANAIVGTADATFSTTAETGTGNATATSGNQVGGLIENPLANRRGIIRTSGNVTATALLRDTVVATTNTGIANATSSSEVVGISGYDITLTGPNSSINVLAGGTISVTSTTLNQTTP